MNKHTMLRYAGYLLVGLWVIFGQDAFVRLSFQELTLESILGVLTPLFAITVFLERTLEVFVSVRRQTDRTGLDLELAAAKGADAKKEVEGRISVYKQDTARITHLVGMFAGLLIAASGVRCLWPLLDQTSLIPDTIQFRVFNLADVFLTAGLLAGGSEGIHRMVTPLKDWFDSKRQ